MEHIARMEKRHADIILSEKPEGTDHLGSRRKSGRILNRTCT
jgi:hypothetical protein